MSDHVCYVKTCEICFEKLESEISALKLDLEKSKARCEDQESCLESLRTERDMLLRNNSNIRSELAAAKSTIKAMENPEKTSYDPESTPEQDEALRNVYRVMGLTKQLSETQAKLEEAERIHRGVNAGCLQTMEAQEKVIERAKELLEIACNAFSSIDENAQDVEYAKNLSQVNWRGIKAFLGEIGGR